MVIVPTKYYTTPTDYFRELGVSLVIWANHNLRACVTAMQNLSHTIYKEQSLASIEKNVSFLPIYSVILHQIVLMSSIIVSRNHIGFPFSTGG